MHAYERWTRDSAEQIRSRLVALRAAGLAVIVGETGPANAGNVVDPWPFLWEAADAGVGVLGWVWKCASSPTDLNAMKGCNGEVTELNDAGNFGWGSGFANYTRAAAARQAQRRERWLADEGLQAPQRRGSSSTWAAIGSVAGVVAMHLGVSFALL